MALAVGCGPGIPAALPAVRYNDAIKIMTVDHHVVDVFLVEIAVLLKIDTVHDVPAVRYKMRNDYNTRILSFAKETNSIFDLAIT